MTYLDNDSIISGIARAREKGYKSEFLFRNGRLIERDSLAEYTTDDCQLITFERYEGMSDPSDSSILFVISCNDGCKRFVSITDDLHEDKELFDFIMIIKNKKV